MKTKILKIENVTIEKTAKGLVFHLPSSFDGCKFKEFKENHKDAINSFKNSYILAILFLYKNNIIYPIVESNEIIILI